MTSAQGTGSLGTPNLLKSDQPDTEAIVLAGDADEAKRLIVQSMALETPSKMRRPHENRNARSSRGGKGAQATLLSDAVSADLAKAIGIHRLAGN